MNPMLDASAGFGAAMFGWSVLLGAALGVVYSSFSLLAAASGTRALGKFLFDLLFFAVSALSVFLLCAARNGGAVRGYVLLGVAVGFGFYYLTVGRFAARCCGAVERAVRRCLLHVRRRLGKDVMKKSEKIRLWLKKRVKTPKKPTKMRKTHLPDKEIT